MTLDSENANTGDTCRQIDSNVFIIVANVIWILKIQNDSFKKQLWRNVLSLHPNDK